MAQRLGAIQVTLTAGEGISQAKEIEGTSKFYGFKTWSLYLRGLCETILTTSPSQPLFPVLDVGHLTGPEMKVLRDVLPAARLLLDAADDSLLSKPAHHGAPQKALAARHAVLNELGKLRIPVNTGIRIGIGESENSWKRAVEIVNDLQALHGNIISFALIPFAPVPFSAMANELPVSNDVYLQALNDVRQYLDPSIMLSTELGERLGIAKECIAAGVVDLGVVRLGSNERLNVDVPHVMEMLRNDLEQWSVELTPRLPWTDKFLHYYRIPTYVAQAVTQFRRATMTPRLSHGAEIAATG